MISNNSENVPDDSASFGGELRSSYRSTNGLLWSLVKQNESNVLAVVFLTMLPRRFAVASTGHFTNKKAVYGWVTH